MIPLAVWTLKSAYPVRSELVLPAHDPLHPESQQHRHASSGNFVHASSGNFVWATEDRGDRIRRFVLQCMSPVLALSSPATRFRFRAKAGKPCYDFKKKGSAPS